MNRVTKSLGLTLAMFLVMGVTAAWGQHEHHHAEATAAQLEVRDDPARGVMKVQIGPLDLPAHSDHDAVPQPPAMFMSIPFEGWLIAYRPRLTDGSGKAVPGRLLHHAAIWHTARPDFLCPEKLEHVFGTGGEMNEWPSVAGYGYRVGRGDRLRIDTMFHNPTGSSYGDVYLEVEVNYRRVEAEQPPQINIYPAWFNVQECRKSDYDIEPGENVTTGEFSMRYSGTLLGVGGHLHDYGRQLVLVNVSRDETIAVLKSKLDDDGLLLAMPVVSFDDQGGYRLNQGEVIRVIATYDNPTGKTLPEGAMGIVVGYFVPEDSRLFEGLRQEEP